VAFAVGGFDYRLCQITTEDMERLKKQAGPWMPRAYPHVYAVRDGVMRVFPTPHQDMDMVQAPEQPAKIAMTWARSVRW
jgi:hypothetical protein